MGGRAEWLVGFLGVSGGAGILAAQHTAPRGVRMEPLYTKYRPQTFEQVVGQKHVVETLMRAVSEHKTSHAYLFCGPRGLSCQENSEAPSGFAH